MTLPRVVSPVSPIFRIYCAMLNNEVDTTRRSHFPNIHTADGWVACQRLTLQSREIPQDRRTSEQAKETGPALRRSK